MNRTLCFAALAGFAFVLSAGQASAQAYGPLDNRVGGSVGGPAAVLPDARVDSRTDSRTGSPGNRAPNGFEASRTTCYKDGEVVDRAYCQSDSFYQPNRIPQTDVFAQRCSNNNPNFNPVTNSFIGLDGIPRQCY